MLLSLMAMALSGQEPADTTVAEPAGRWMVDFGERDCLAARVYETRYGKAALRLRPEPVGSGMRIEMLFLENAIPEDIGQMTLVGAPDSRTTPRLMVMPDGNSLIRTHITRHEPHAQLVDERYALTFEGAEALAFPIHNRDGIDDALRICQRDLRETHGISEDVVNAVRTPAKTDVRFLFTVDDYPTHLLRSGKGGTAYVRYTITEKGRIEECDIWESSGHGALDRRSCEVLKRRYRGEPALDAAGEPVPEIRITGITFEVQDL